MVLLAATLWGGSGLFVGFLSSAGLTATQYTMVRSICAYATILVVVLARDWHSIRVEMKDVPWFILNGAIGIFAFTLLYATTIQLTGMATAAVLIYLMPSIVFVYQVLRHRERVSALRLVCLALSLAGCALVSGVLSPGTKVVAGGIVMGVIAAITYAVCNLTQAGPLSKYPTSIVVLHSLGIAMVLSIVYALLTDDMSAAFAIYARNPSVLVVNAAFGILCSVVTYLLYNGALRKIPASQAALLATFEPVAAALLGAAFLGQRLDFATVAGIACEVVALILTQYAGQRSSLNAEGETE
jgi:DME family drug/metabolite transporter